MSEATVLLDTDQDRLESMEFKIGVFHQGEDTEFPCNWIVWDADGDEIASNWEPTESEAVKAACDYIIENT